MTASLGNLTIAKSGETVVLTLITHHKGHPRAVFTGREIAQLIRLLKDAAARIDEPDDFSDLI